MPCRLPLELELTVLELAAPALEFDNLHRRVDFFINVSLVHRSLMAWAQDKLRDQLLYTYRLREDEYERLKQRLEAGFGRDRRLCRLYLDLTQSPTARDTHSVATTEGRVSGASLLPNALSDSRPDGATAQKEAVDEVAHFVLFEDAAPDDGRWELCSTIMDYSQKLDTLWLKHPILELDLQNLPGAWPSEPAPEHTRIYKADD